MIVCWILFSEATLFVYLLGIGSCLYSFYSLFLGDSVYFYFLYDICVFFRLLLEESVAIICIIFLGSNLFCNLYPSLACSSCTSCFTLSNFSSCGWLILLFIYFKQFGLNSLKSVEHFIIYHATPHDQSVINVALYVCMVN